MPEKARIFIATPHHRDMEPEYVMSVFKTALTLSRIGVTCDYTPMEGCYVSETRNNLRKKFLEGTANYILFADSDSIFDPLVVIELLDADKDIIGAMYRMREIPFLPIAYKLIPELGEGYFRRIEFDEIKSQPFICGAVGAGLLLIKRKVLEKMSEPSFVKAYGYPFNMWQRPDGIQLGEDMSFSLRARIAGFDTWCYPSQTMAHVGTLIIANNSVMAATFPHYSNDVEGWMSSTELNWLYQTAKGMESIVEIGSWKGRSTLALLNGCPGLVYAVDTFKGSKDELESTHKEATEKDIEAIFKKNTSNFLNLKTYAMTSEEAASQIGPVDMVFIDGDHAAAKQDIDRWLPKTKKLICGHDLNWPSVMKAVEESFDGRHRKCADSIWCCDVPF